MALSYDRLKGLPVLALRLGTSFGLRMRPNSVFSLFINKALSGEPITIQGTGEQARQFTHARDIARAFAMAIETEIHGQAINVVSEESTSIKTLAELIQRRLPTTVEYKPARAGDIHPAKVNSRKAKELLGWRSGEVSAGLDEMIDAAVTVPVG